MIRTIAPATQTTSFAAVAGSAFAWALSGPILLWQRQRRRDGLRNLLHKGSHLICDTGISREDLEEMSGAPFWQSAHVPTPRHF